VNLSLRKYLLVASALFSLETLVNAAATSPQLADLELQLERKAQSLVSKIDETAVVSLKLEPKTTDVKLPLTNLVVRDVNVRSSDSSVEIKSAKLTIFSEKFQIDESIKKLLAEALGLKPGIIKFNVQSLPNQNTASTAETDLPSLIALQKYAIPIVLFVLGFVFFSTLGIFLGIRSINKLRTSLTEASKILAQKLESTQQTMDLPASNIRALNDSNIKALPQGESSSNYNDYSKNSFLSLITDCYWSEYDEYGAYIWKKIPINIKQEILREVSFLQSYTSYLATKHPTDLGLEQHPSYLDPLPIYLLDNASVTKIVLDNPSIFSKVSPLRMEKLDIPANILVELDSAVDGNTASQDSLIKTISSSPASEPRNLRSSQEFRIRSIEDEQALLERDPFDINLARRVRSLGWLVRLQESKVVEILENFSAKELATAWIGPESVLKQLEDKLSEGKRENLKSYCANTIQSRDSVAFNKLFQLSLSELEKNALENPDGEEHHNEAA